MNSAVEVVRSFFGNMNTPTSGELLQYMDVYTMMRLIKFGKRMSQEAQEQAIECKLLGRELDANAIAKDVTTIQGNLNSLTQAYAYAMN